MQRIRKMHENALKKILVKGLHSHLDIEIDLQPGLNVIYGKNGKGKTTLLHILANILELDFQRFSHLSFQRVELTSYKDEKLELIKIDTNHLSINFNGRAMGSRQEGQFAPLLSESEAEVVSEAFGGRPVYLPAYRAILEKVKTSPYDQPRDVDYELIRNSEMLAGSKINSIRYGWRGNEQRASIVARKTLQCRDWFGPFVPVIRYPALAEVVESITEEFTDAQMATSQSERRMLSTTFIEVFRSLVSKQNAPSDGEIGPLMSRVKNALDMEEEEQASFPDYLGRSLIGELEGATDYSSAEESAAQKRVLKLYAELLERRKSEKLEAFEKIRNFESAINRFLDQKSFKVSNRANAADRRRQYVFIETEAGSTYPVSTLSSGERQILTMLFSATRMSNFTTGVFLIDEPELSLHVDWQRIILRELNAQAPHRQIIACTHSPEVGADHYEAVQIFSPAVASKENGPTQPTQDPFLDDLI